MSLELVDPQDQFKTTIIKWGKFAKKFTQDGNSIHPRNGSTCKDKWDSIYDNFKWIHHYMQSTNHNEIYSIGI